MNEAFELGKTLERSNPDQKKTLALPVQLDESVAPAGQSA